MTYCRDSLAWMCFISRSSDFCKGYGFPAFNCFNCLRISCFSSTEMMRCNGTYGISTKVHKKTMSVNKRYVRMRRWREGALERNGVGDNPFLTEVAQPHTLPSILISKYFSLIMLKCSPRVPNLGLSRVPLADHFSQWKLFQKPVWSLIVSEIDKLISFSG